MSVYNWILDAGHGGMKNGVYTTAPKKLFKWPDGFIIYEGVINRAIVSKLSKLLSIRKIDHALVHSETEDTPLQERVAIADKLYAKNKQSVYVSIHSNAGGGSGFEIFTSPGQTKSDKIANIFCETYAKLFPEFKQRVDKSDGDADKEADFYVLRKTDCPAILIENLFFDNRVEAELLMKDDFQLRIAQAIEQAIVTCENIKPI